MSHVRGDRHIVSGCMELRQEQDRLALRVLKGRPCENDGKQKTRGRLPRSFERFKRYSLIILSSTELSLAFVS